MVADGVGDLGVEAFGEGEVAAGDTLDFGEFADGGGDEVCLAQAGGLFGEVGEAFPSRSGRGDGRTAPLSINQRASLATRSTLSATVPSFS
jgi:hypothetical protein